jgi:hypothetical protein
MYARKKTNLRIAAIAALGLLMSAGDQAQASIFTFNFDTIITGPAPSGSSIATLTIADSGLNSVLITLDHNSTSSAGQFITDLYFNLSPYSTVVQSGQTPINKFDGPLLQGLDSEQTAGINFDLHQGFEQSNSGGGVNRLKPGESVSFTLTGTGISAADFVSTGVPTGGNRNDVYAMIHLQGLPNGQSVKLGSVVPEPATMAAMGIGLAILLAKRRAKRTNA